MLHPDKWPSAQKAFESAIQMGFLSDDPKADNYAGWFMFIGLDDDGVMLFKGIDDLRTSRCE